MPIECYSQRLLNPYRGTMQVIRFESAEAVSTDGLNWDIYVSNDELRAGLEGRVQTSDIRYGHWSAKTGLKRGPLYPSEDFRRMERMGSIVYEHLLEVHERVPFPLRDRFECWLMDRAGQPLALLDSALDDTALDMPNSPGWRPGMAAQSGFVRSSPSVRSSEDAGCAADCLARLVNQRAATPAASLWIERDPDGSGRVIVMEGEGASPRLPGALFPELLVAAPDGGEDGRFLEDFLAWQAVWLLMLPLSPSTRARLEPHVDCQPERVEGAFRLYPQILDEGPINAARVRARLEQTQTIRTVDADDELSTLHILTWGTEAD